MGTPEYRVGTLQTLWDQLQAARTPAQLDQYLGCIQRIQEEAGIEQDRHESLAMQWSGVGFRASNILAQIPAIRARLPTIASLSDLIPSVTNEHQRQPLERLLTRNESNQIYLSEYTPSTHRDVEGVFTVLGTMRKGQRERYEVKWYRPHGRTSFWCNCPDHKFNSSKKQIVCKHICFLVCRVGRILDPQFFTNHQFTPEQRTIFAQRISENTLFADTSLRPPPAPAVGTEFTICRKPIAAEDDCPICYDSLASMVCLSCPTCSNNVHKECMEVWLEGHRTCVYCRSTVWSSWKTSV